jgi:hypothetical protein
MVEMDENSAPSELPLSTQKEAAMPTVVYFIGGEKPCTLQEDFDKVNATLGAHEAGRFTRLVGDRSSRVTVYKSGIAYIAETSDAEPMVVVG